MKPPTKEKSDCSKISNDDKENHRWLMQQVVQSTTEAELKAVLIDMGDDMFEGEPWTRDKVMRSRLRHVIERQRRRLGVSQADI